MSNFDVENMTVMFQNSLEMSDKPSVSGSLLTSHTMSGVIEHNTTEVSDTSKNSISSTSHSIGHPTLPVDTPYDSIAMGKDLIAMLQYIDELKGTPSHSVKKTQGKADSPCTIAAANLGPTPLDHTTIETEKSQEENKSLTKIQMTRTQKGKGRPKGATLNAIGLPRRKNVPLQFHTKQTRAKTYDILGWLFPAEVKEAAYNSEYLLSKDDVNSATQNLKDAFNDDSVDINIVKVYFGEDAFKLLNKAVMEKRKHGFWTCGACCKPIVDDDKTTKFCIMCENCLEGNHSQCVGPSRKPRSQWFCRKCSSN